MALFRKPAVQIESANVRGFVITITSKRPNPFLCTVEVKDPEGKEIAWLENDEDDVVDTAVKMAREVNPDCPRAVEFYWAK